MEHTKLTLALCSLLLAGCGSEDSAGAGAGASAGDINNLVKQTNFASGFPGLYKEHLYGEQLDQQGVVRFDTTGQIPLYYVSTDGSNVPQKIINGVAQIEARLGDIFTDFTLISDDLSGFRDNSYSNENRGNNSYNHTTFTNAHGIANGGLIISLNTAFYSTEYANNPQSMCGNASIGPYTGSLSLIIDENTHTYTEDNLLWVNLDNTQGCSWDTAMVVHEMAHAMGMYKHIDDYFGSWSSTAMNILATMYSNNSGTAYENLLPDLN